MYVVYTVYILRMMILYYTILTLYTGPPNQERNFETSFNNKKQQLIKILNEQTSSKNQRTIIFCNTISQCRNVENVLLRLDRSQRQRQVLIYHSAIDNKIRDENMMSFSKRLLQKPVVMVCTDRASRGMDFDAVPVSIYVHV